MKTTIEIRDVLFRNVKSKAADRSQTLKEFVSEALQEQLAPRTGTARSGEPEWMRGFGKLRHLRKETSRIQERISRGLRTSGALRVTLKRSGRPIPANDAWIAALASQHHLPVLSRDAHFDVVPGFTRRSW